MGSRRSSKYGEDIAYRLGAELGKRGAIIVSGLAYGIDSCAHRGCLDYGGTTVAILGTPIDKIYPSCHETLGARILEKGAIISEYEPGHETLRTDFLDRNRIVAGVCDALVVVEAAEHSGTFTTLSQALNNNGCEIYVVPGDITRPTSQGCNMMLKDAQPITDIDSFVAHFFPSKKADRRRRLQRLPERERLIAEQILGGVGLGEEIAAATRLSAHEFNQLITVMELKGIVRPLGCNYWALA